MLDLAGLPVPPGLDGVSLLPMVAHEAASAEFVACAEPADALAGPVSYAETYYPRFHYNWSELIAVETERWKFVRAPRPELYDLRKDPKELHDVSAEHPEVAATLARQLDSMNLLERPAARPRRPSSIPKRSRGCGPSATSAAPNRRRPADRAAAGSQGRTAAAPGIAAGADRPRCRTAGRGRQRLEALAREGPARTRPSSWRCRRSTSAARTRRGPSGPANAPSRSTRVRVAVLDLAFAFQAAGRRDEAATGFDRVLALDPDNLKALLNLGEIHHARGEREKAFELYQRAVAAAPRLARAQISLGSVALELNRFDVAEEALKQAVALGGNQPDLHFNLGVMAEAARPAARLPRASTAPRSRRFRIPWGPG